MGVNRYEDLEIWQIARGLVREVYTVSDEGRFSHDFAMRDQMRRAALSTMLNIAEGDQRQALLLLSDTYFSRFHQTVVIG
jgi:four helix bundle protein